MNKKLFTNTWGLNPFYYDAQIQASNLFHTLIYGVFCRTTFTMFVSSCTAQLADRVNETNAASYFQAERIERTHTVAPLRMFGG